MSEMQHPDFDRSKIDAPTPEQGAKKVDYQAGGGLCALALAACGFLAVGLSS